MATELLKPPSSIMKRPTRHDGFLHFELTKELQDLLHDVDGLLLKPDGSIAPGQLEPCGEGKVTMSEIPWGNREEEGGKQGASRKILIEMKPGIAEAENWPNEKTEVNWEGGDWVLERGALNTPKGRRNLFIPRPFPSEQDVEVIVQNKNTKSWKYIEWKLSEAYMLEANVRIYLLKGTIRFFLLTTRWEGC